MKQVIHKAKLIQASLYKDERGKVIFANEFDMSQILRTYVIQHNDIETIRAWQGHAKEQKWFFCVQGAFIINLVWPQKMEHPTGAETVSFFLLAAAKPCIFHIEGGSFTGIQALQPDSILTVYSDVDLETSKKDDFRRPLDFWPFKKKL